MNRLFPPLILVAAAVAFCPWPTYADDDQSETRENPTVETGNAAALASVNYPKYIKLGANHIQMNGDDWSDLAEVFAAADSCPVNIVHIGDSHLQADMGTAVSARNSTICAAAASLYHSGLPELTSPSTIR